MMSPRIPAGAGAAVNLSKDGSASAPPVVTSSTTAVAAEIRNSKELKQAHSEGKNIPVSEEQLIKAIERAIKAVEGTTTTLDFSIHEKTKRIVVKVLDKETGQIIREIPPEKNLDFVAKLWEKAGLLIDERR